MFPNVPRGFNIAKIIGGLSKSLNVANQMIPLYQQLSPMVQNARKAFGALKEMSNTPQNKNNNNIQVNNNQNKRTIKTSSNNPSFFQ